jgi:hypothetical protein
LLAIVYGCGGPTVTMIDVTATASGGTEFNASVWNQNNASPTIRQSKLSVSTNSLLFDQTTTGKVALTQLVGPVHHGPGATLQCFNNYDQNMAAVTCR